MCSLTLRSTTGVVPELRDAGAGDTGRNGDPQCWFLRLGVLSQSRQCKIAGVRIATWCVGGINSRLPYLCHWLGRRRPELVALQKTLARSDRFPREALQQTGYESVVYSRDGEFHSRWGVAVLSRKTLPEPRIMQEGLPGQEDPGARFLAVAARELEFSSVYALYSHRRTRGRFDNICSTSSVCPRSTPMRAIDCTRTQATSQLSCEWSARRHLSSMSTALSRQEFLECSELRSFGRGARRSIAVVGPRWSGAGRWLSEFAFRGWSTDGGALLHRTTAELLTAGEWTARLAKQRYSQ